MNVAAAILLGLAIIMGIIMMTYLFKEKEIPKGLPFIHGGFAGAGIILLVIYALTTESQHRHWDSIIIFLVAALGGLYLFEKDITHQKLSKGVAIIHALIALGGFTWLIIYLLK